MRLPNLTKSRHGVFYLRLQRNGVDCRLSLKTKDFHQAKIVALVFNLELMANPKITSFDLDALKERARKLDIKLPNGVELNNIHTIDELAFAEKFIREFDPIDNVGRLNASGGFGQLAQPRPAKPTTKKYLEVSESYLKEAAFKNVESTVTDKRREYKRFVEIFGDLMIGQINDESAVAYKNRLISEGLTMRQINKRISYNKELFEYAITNKFYSAMNPFLNLSVGDKKSLEEATEHYDDFTLGELAQIFYRQDYNSYMKKSDYKYGPFLSLYSGARLEEICSLKLEQIHTDVEIPYFEIKHAKNKNSLRKIPFHKNILNSSFMDFIEQKKAERSVMLFDHLVEGKNGYGKNLGRRFAQYLDKLNIKSPTKVFHSFRHTVINHLANKNVNPALIMGLVGHYYQAKLDLSSVHFETYQHDKTLSAMKSVVDMINYEIQFKVD